MRKEESKYHHGDLKRGLVLEAIKQIDREGVGALTFRVLARRLGVSHTAPYRHFADKQALLREVAQEGFRQLVEALEKSGNDIEGLAWCYVQFAQESPMRLALMFGPELASCREEGDDASRAFDLVIGILRRASPDTTDEELRIRAVAAWSMAHGLAVLAMNGQLRKQLEMMGVEQLTRRVARLLEATFGASPESTRS